MADTSGSGQEKHAGAREQGAPQGESAVDSTCGCEEPALGSYFVSAYPPFEYWTPSHLDAYREALGTPAADRQSPLGLYVHIPFCARRCDFCYFLSYQGRSISDVDAYLEALPQELDQYCQSLALDGRDFDFVYFGGGTPSLLTAERLETLLRRLSRCPSTWEPREFTFECAPQSISREKLEVLRACGVTRISMGVQQLDDTILRLNGRVHMVADIERAFETIRSEAFDVVNLDLIVGLLGETDDTFFPSLEKIVAMAPESVTLYQLEIPHNTPLYRSLNADAAAASLPTWETKRRRLGQAFDRLEQEGYSIRSGYTAVRDPERHEFLYQDLQYKGADLVGIGASSFSFINGVHQQNIADLDEYLAAASPYDLPLWRAYALDQREQMVREFVLQLKLGSVDTAYFETRFGIDPRKEFEVELSSLHEKGWLTAKGQVLRLTRDGLVRVDALLDRFYSSTHRPPGHRAIRTLHPG